MIERHFVTILVAVAISSILIYRLSWFEKKKVFHLSLQQFMLLIVVPAVIFPMMVSYLLAMMQRPLSQNIVVSDTILFNLVLLALIFMYGAVSIHAVTKILTRYLQQQNSEAERINRFFHLTFSHNLGYSSGLIAIVGITILELNHIPVASPQNLISGFIKGIVLSLSFFFAMSYYTKYIGDIHQGKWADLKVVFLVIWLGFVMLLYGINKVNPSFDEYQLLLPTLLSFGFLGIMSVVLVVRRVKRGWQLRVRQRALRELMEEMGVPQ